MNNTGRIFNKTESSTAASSMEKSESKSQVMEAFHNCIERINLFTYFHQQIENLFGHQTPTYKQ